MHPSFSGNAADLYNKYNIDHFQKEEFDNFLDVMSHLVFENPKKAITKFEGNKKSKEILVYSQSMRISSIDFYFNRLSYIHKLL